MTKVKCQGSGHRVSCYDMRFVCNYDEDDIECEYRTELKPLTKDGRIMVYFCRNPIWKSVDAERDKETEK